MILRETSRTPKTNITGFPFYLEFSFNNRAWKEKELREEKGRTTRKGTRKTIKGEGVDMIKVCCIHR